MLDILKFELYKIVKRKLFLFSPIIIFGMTVTLLMASLSSVSSYDENGNYVKGHKSIKYEKKYAEKISGELTPEKIADVIEMYNKIYADADNLNENNVIRESVYISQLYPYNRLVSYIAAVYTHTGLQPDYNIIRDLKYEDGLDFYNRREEQLIGTLNMDYSYGNYSDGEKMTILKFDGELSEPFVIGYTLGWENLTENLFPFLVILTFVAFINVSSVFSDEFQRGTAQIILSAKHGRGKVFVAKTVSAFLISTSMFAVFVGAFILTFGLVFGFDGSGASIQSLALISVYDLSLGEAFFTAILIAYAVFIFMIFFALTVSVLCRSNFTSVLLVSALYFIPLFLRNSQSSKLCNYLVDLLPIKAMNVFDMFRQYKLYGFSGAFIKQPYFVMVLMPVLSVILIAAARKIYSRLNYN